MLYILETMGLSVSLDTWCIEEELLSRWAESQTCREWSFAPSYYTDTAQHQSARTHAANVVKHADTY